MFEDSTFESTARIRTRTRGWMIESFTFNSTILLTMILVPLIYTQALPHQAIAFLIAVPPLSATPPPPLPRQLRSAPTSTNMSEGQIQMPTRIPRTIVIPFGPEPANITNVASMDPGDGVPGGFGDAFGHQPAPRVVHPDIKTPVRVSSAVEAGLIIRKVIPTYPPLGKAMHVEGTVVLAATISKDGAIANLRIVSGPAVLQQAAYDAVSNWRYRPYLLNGQPVDGETTINLSFTLGG
jgi:periplasmic protein TonB